MSSTKGLSKVLSVEGFDGEAHLFGKGGRRPSSGGFVFMRSGTVDAEVLKPEDIRISIGLKNRPPSTNIAEMQ